jgi:polyisoprenoid-binding protein YceI
MLGKELWEIDSASSQLGFSLRHIVVSEIHGRFATWGGQMIFDPENVDRSLIKVWIDAASIDTGSVERDAHLRSPEFLDVARFPRAEFASTGVTIRRDGEAVLSGRLRLHGISRDVEVDVVTDRTWLDANKRLHVVYLAHGEIDRQAFGLHWNQDLDVGGVVVGDTVELEARIEMVRTADSVLLSERQPEGDPAQAP